MHHVVHLLVLHPQTGDILLQKRRADRAVAPGLWDSAAAGHVCAGESAESALQRECAEEIGYKIISVPPPNSLQSGQDEIRWIGCYRMQKQSECEYCDVWSLISAGPFRPDRSEMDALEWFSREDCLRLEEEGLITASAIRDLALATGAGSP
jgi:isopentenyldiphosphate isomerase